MKLIVNWFGWSADNHKLKEYRDLSRREETASELKQNF